MQTIYRNIYICIARNHKLRNKDEKEEESNTLWTDTTRTNWLTLTDLNV